ncbi:PREDICTED: uncharacterized protein LOC104785617 [Camelina sativa]|uniref:Uncharacterized protein LOC104785617 n=1 Tax=Camelina sativa TaxID=90675 RepID=A0ABM0Z1N9_CAMSA|nr:PREDICTED: uncharacterized protein LOC104785617 [Camelina sativa]
MPMGKKHLSISSLNYQSEDNNCKNSLFFGLFDDHESTRLRSGSMKRQYSDMGDSYHRVYEEQNDDVDYNGDGDGDDDERSKMDMKVLMVLEYMRELYVGQLQLLKEMFPGGAKDEFVGFFNKIGDAVTQIKQDSRPPPTKSMTMQRSLSARSPRVTSKGVNLGPSDLRDERFKVTTVNAGGAGGAGGAAGGDKGGSTAGQGQTKK